MRQQARQHSAVTLGTSTGPFIQHTFWLNNDTGNTVTVNLLTGPSSPSFSGPGADDYVINPLCRPACDGALPGTITMTPGYSALIGVVFFPDALGDGSATMTITASDGSQAQVNLSGTGSIGYYQVDEFGDVATYGDAAWYGDTGNDNLNSPIVGMAGTRDNGGALQATSIDLRPAHDGKCAGEARPRGHGG